VTSTHRPGSSSLVLSVALALALLAVACDPHTSVSDPEPVPALPDGEMFAMVTIGSDETGATTLGVDVAEMLSGEEARVAAVEDGVISEGEDLPNDFYIENDEHVLELLHISADPSILVISGNDTSQLIEIDVDMLWQLWNGDFNGPPIYGIVPSVPIPMELTVASGVVTSLEMVYLP